MNSFGQRSQYISIKFSIHIKILKCATNQDGGFTTGAVKIPPERKLAKRTSVQSTARNFMVDEKNSNRIHCDAYNDNSTVASLILYVYLAKTFPEN